MQEEEHAVGHSPEEHLPVARAPHPVAPIALRPALPALLDPRLGEQGGDSDEINLRQYWQVILKHKWTVLAALAIVFVSTLVATLLMTPIYRATTTLEIDRDTIKVVEVQGMTPVESMSDDFYKTQYELLRSNALAERTARAMNLGDDPDYLHLQRRSALSRLFGLLRHGGGSADAASAPSRDPVELGGFVGAHLTIDPILDSRLVRISFDSPNPKLAAKVANAVADNFMAANLERGLNSTAYARQYLENRLAQTKQKLEDSETQLVQVAQKEKIFSSSDGTSLAAQNLAALNSQLSLAQEARIRAQARWEQASVATGANLPSDMLSSSIVGSLRKSRADLMAQYQEKLATYKPAFPAMVQLKNQIDELDKQIAVEVGNVKASVRSEYEAAQAQEAMLLKQMDVLKTQVLDQQNRSIRYNVLKREVDTNRQLYDGLLQRYKEISVAGGVTTNNMSVVDRADVPGAPYKPDLRMNLMLATFFGLAFGVVLALFFEYLDDTLKSADDVEKHLGLPVLGIIPKLSEISPRQALENPRSAFAEAYRSVRTALQFSTASGVPRTLLITSSVPGEGKSTTAYTLAHNFAQLGKRVLLIDADLRNPSLHRTLGLDNDAGLSNCLTGAAKPQEVIRTQAEDNLDVMTSGPLPPNPAELLAGPKMLALLTVAMSKYDQIIVDGPPTMGIADAPILSNIAKGTLLIVDAGRTRREIARASVKRLRASQAHLLGALLTKADNRMGGYGYGYSGYDYYYAYGEGTPKLTKQ